ncbi:MAG: signal peptidase I, partial [Chloroflexi bacterium]|nr:signal peptidase I [Chloroflexota bacterium]
MTSVRLVILLLLFVYSGLSAYSGNFLPLRLVKGDSMEPTLTAGDVILLKSVPFSAIGDGDIV